MKFARPINDTTPRVTTQYSLKHKGTDYGYGAGTPVYASADGFVNMAVNAYKTNWKQGSEEDPSKAFDMVDYGNSLKINHGEDYETLYAHLKFNSILVKAGEFVKKGQKIAEVGNTGNSTGNHLHWEVRKNGKTIEPSAVMDRTFKSYFEKKPTPSTPLKDTVIDFDDAEVKRKTVGWYVSEWAIEKQRANDREWELGEVKQTLEDVRAKDTDVIRQLNEKIRELVAERATLMEPTAKNALQVLINLLGVK